MRRVATALLAGVGGETEWWFWNPAAHVGHYRVAVTGEEYAAVPPGLAISDAGPSGPAQSRRRR